MYYQSPYQQPPLSFYSSSPSMSVSGIQGQLLEVTVVGCNKLKDTEWISRQDPYVFVEYGSTKSRTRTCTDGGKNPTFQEKFMFNLIEGLREMKVVVYNSNTVTYDDFIGSGSVQLQKVLSQGYDDSAWPIQSKTGRHAGEVRLILHFANANRQATGFAPSAPPYATHQQAPMYGYPTPAMAPYPPQPAAAAYPTASSYSTYPPTSAYPPVSYPPPPQSAAYPLPPQSAAYPPAGYPPPPSAYPPATYPPQASPFPGLEYPPPPPPYY